MLASTDTSRLIVVYLGGEQVRPRWGWGWTSDLDSQVTNLITTPGMFSMPGIAIANVNRVYDRNNERVKCRAVARTGRGGGPKVAIASAGVMPLGIFTCYHGITGTGGGCSGQQNNPEYATVKMDS